MRGSRITGIRLGLSCFLYLFRCRCGSTKHSGIIYSLQQTDIDRSLADRRSPAAEPFAAVSRAEIDEPGAKERSMGSRTLGHGERDTNMEGPASDWVLLFSTICITCILAFLGR
ncbi:uncharacterized protein B0H64DRAFT_199488 [Chaetomium fimeti]|uniref:Uncharacterized protein n=1 Tax=Chaetomium fimeti TaxID=1854472 RepID=A0AAE0LRU9_9PEZI|nr:hypothetical protein B0H64DRAFT_199488 [Chaetomium fimeti]